MKRTADCLIVTYNRLNLLKECIQAVLHQKMKPTNIIVVNNNSTDGTDNYLKKISNQLSNLKILNLNENLGGAGGFNAGFKYFIQNSSSDYLWLMDDDAIPNNLTLKNLLSATDLLEDFGFLASDVRWTNNEPAKMNVPNITKDWNKKINLGLVKIKSASFVSLLIPRKVIEKVGYPIKDFFIWGDDMEYTTRIVKANYEAFLVINSQIMHKIYKNIPPDIIKETKPDRIKRYYFESRNVTYIYKKYHGFKGLCRELARYSYISLRLIFSNSKFKSRKLKYLIKGTIVGVGFNPKVEMVKKKQVDNLSIIDN